MKKLLLVATATVLLLTGCAVTAPAPELFEVPDVVGMAGDEAQASLRDAGFEVTFDAGADSVWMPSNWTVDSQIPEAGAKVEAGVEIALAVSKPVEVPATDGATPPANVTSLGLDVPAAIITCDQAGEDSSPYGWNADFLWDGTQTVRADDILLKAGVDITNAYNAEGRFTVECVVGGTNDAPVITEFTVY